MNAYSLTVLVIGQKVRSILIYILTPIPPFMLMYVSHISAQRGRGRVSAATTFNYP